MSPKLIPSLARPPSARMAKRFQHLFLRNRFTNNFFSFIKLFHLQPSFLISKYQFYFFCQLCNAIFMPELPEVETTVRKLKPLLNGKRILQFNKKILEVERRGKAILIWLEPALTK